MLKKDKIVIVIGFVLNVLTVVLSLVCAVWEGVAANGAPEWFLFTTALVMLAALVYSSVVQIKFFNKIEVKYHR